MPAITTHVLDISRGRPATSVGIILEIMASSHEPQLLMEAQTNHDGRVLPHLYHNDLLELGDYRIIFKIKDYFNLTNRPCFYPLISINFSITQPQEHHHIALLVSPFGYSTYRGS